MTARRWDVLGGAALFVLAFGARLGLVLASPGGLTGNLGDDAAVYYTGADALLHGRLPYRDFTLLHPPLLILVLVPFAALGLAFGDHVGFQLATLANHATGAACAVLVVLLCRRYGFGRPAAYTAGIFYAVWFGSALTDMLIRLETLATLLTLLGLLALTRQGTRWALLAGAALGLATASKIWGVVPVAVVVLWLAVPRASRRRAGLVAAGAAAAVVVAVGPFFAAAPRATWRMLVSDQLGREAYYPYRLAKMTTVYVVDPARDTTAQTAWTWMVCAVAIVLALLALRVAAGRMLVALLVVEVVVLLRSPSYFEHYLGLLDAPLAVTVGAAMQAVARSSRRARAPVWALTAAAVAGAASVTAFAMTRSEGSGPRRFPTAEVAAAIDGTRCPTTDGPASLILTDQLSRTLAQGCAQWVDVIGRVHDVDRLPGNVPRAQNERWQRDLERYLLSGEVTIVFEPGAHPGPRLRARLDRLPVLVDRDGVVVRRVR